MRFTSNVISYRTTNWYNLYPIGDIHLGSLHCDRKLLEATLAEIAADPYALWIGMGDAIDGIVPTDKRFSANEIDPQFLPHLQRIAEYQRDVFVEYFEPIKDKCLGLIEGNHEHTVLTRHYMDVTRQAAKTLEVPFLGSAAMIRLGFQRMDGSGRQIKGRNFMIYAEHGSGGGKKSGAKINNIEELSRSYDAQIYLRGHVHQRIVTRGSRVFMTTSGRPAPVITPQVFALTGSYLKSIHDGEDSYANRSGFLPTDLGCVKLALNPMTGEIRSTI